MPTTVLARLREHIEPMDRGSRYEDPVDAVLRERGLGQVTGGGSQLSESGELEYADIELELANLDFDETSRTRTEAAGESSYHGYWQGSQETGLFFFHTDAETLFDRLEPV